MTPSNISDKDAVRQFFTSTATDYSTLFHPRRTGSSFGFRRRLALAMQMTGDISGSLFDCACGSGEITAAILNSRRFTRATIVDLSPRMLELAQKQMEAQFKMSEICNLKFVSSDIFAFDTQSCAGGYDLVLCLGLIAHTGRLDHLLAKLKTLLSPNGSILLQSSLLDHLGNRVVRSITQERYFRQHGYRISYFRHQEILDAAQKAGLDVAATRRFCFGFPLGDRFSAWINYHVENAAKGWSESHGAEALYVLRNSVRTR